eukprot:PITA_30117
MLKLNLQGSLRKTTTVLQLADRSTVILEGIMEDVMVSIDSWDYLADFLVLQPKAKLTGYPLILGRPWLATANAYIRCRSGNMTIKNGHMSEQLVLYPLAQPTLEHDLPLWLLEEEEDEVYYAQLYALEATIGGEQQYEDDLIEHLLQSPTPSSLPLEEEVRGTQNNHPIDLCLANSNPLCVKTIEFFPKKTLKINPSLSALEEENLCNMLRENLEAFARSYNEMKGVHPSMCTHHIYIKEDCKPVKKPQRRMNPTLKDIVKEELQKLLDAGFIYLISDSEWVTLLVLVPKKNGKWRICVDYRELIKATKKDNFPLPFIDQVLDGLAGKKFFSFLDGFSGYNQIQMYLEDQDKTTFTCARGTFAYRVVPFGLCNDPATFQRAVLSIFAELVHDVVEIYMDDFTPYGCDFQEALTNLSKVLHKCIEMNMSLSPEKCEFLMTEGTMLCHSISQQGLQEFDLNIVDKPGKENVVAEFLFRMNLPIGEEGMVDDQVPYENLFAISVLSPWFANISNYLVSAQFPPNLPSKEKSKIVRKISPFT